MSGDSDPNRHTYQAYSWCYQSTAALGNLVSGAVAFPLQLGNVGMQVVNVLSQPVEVSGVTLALVWSIGHSLVLAFKRGSHFEEVEVFVFGGCAHASR